MMRESIANVIGAVYQTLFWFNAVAVIFYLASRSNSRDFRVLLKWENITRYATIASAFLFFCGCAYLWGFWHVMDIDPFKHVSFSEIAHLSIYNVLPTMGVTALVFITPLTTSYFVSARLKRRMEPLLVKLHRLEGPILGFLSVVWFFFNYSYRFRGYIPEIALLYTLPLLGLLLRNYLRLHFTGWQKSRVLWLIIFVTPSLVAFNARHEAMNILKSGTTVGSGNLDLTYAFIEEDPVLKEYTANHSGEIVYVGRLGAFLCFATRNHRGSVLIPDGKMRFLFQARNTPGAPGAVLGLKQDKIEDLGRK
jgi:hypothetical protein